MSKYASLLFGADKYYEVGPFRFPIYEDLVPGESRHIEEYAKKQSKATFKSLKLAQRIAKDKDITTKAAIDLMTKIGASGEEAPEIIYEYAEEIEDMQNQGVNATDQKISFVTLFMQYRAEAKLDDSEDWTPLKDWTTTDTEKMPTKLMDNIFQLMLWERDGWPKHEDVPGNAKETTETPPRKKQ